MLTINLKNIVTDTSSNEQGSVLYGYLESAVKKESVLLIKVDSDLSLSSSFLHTSIGLFIETYGLETFKQLVKVKGSKNQFKRLATYVKDYSSLYSA